MSAKNSHLTLEDRQAIQKGLNNGSPKTAIAQVIGKDNSTIGKEVKKHRIYCPAPLYKESSVVIKNVIRDCVYIKTGCPYNGKIRNNKCLSPCERAEPIPCKIRDRKLVCNGCSKIRTCVQYKYKYDAEVAHQKYTQELSDSRTGLNMSPEEFDSLGNLLSSCMSKGQSIEVILENHPEITLSSRRIHSLVNDGYFKPYGVDQFTKRRTVNRKQAAKKAVYKPRVDRKYLKGRTNEDFKAYMDAHPDTIVWQMDTVYNDVSNGPFIQTFIHPESSFMIGIYHDEKTAQEMLSGVRTIRNWLGSTRFKKYFNVILTDRGSEFTKAEEIERLGVRIFYCDPMRSSQKAEVEKNHTLLRYICPKETDLRQLGLRSQKDLNLIFSHINSYRRIHKFNKTPIENIVFLLNDESLPKDLCIETVDKDEVLLRPALIKKRD